MWGLAAPACHGQTLRNARDHCTPAPATLARSSAAEESPTRSDCIQVGPADAAGGGVSESTLATDNYNIRNTFAVRTRGCPSTRVRPADASPKRSGTGYNLIIAAACRLETWQKRYLSHLFSCVWALQPRTRMRHLSSSISLHPTNSQLPAAFRALCATRLECGFLLRTSF